MGYFCRVGLVLQKPLTGAQIREQILTKSTNCAIGQGIDWGKAFGQNLLGDAVNCSPNARPYSHPLRECRSVTKLEQFARVVSYL